MMAESKSVPLRFKKPASAMRGSPAGRITRASLVKSPRQLSPIDLPDTVSASGCGSMLAFSSSAMMAGSQHEYHKGSGSPGTYLGDRLRGDTPHRGTCPQAGC